jgi:hypothetical protein
MVRGWNLIGIGSTQEVQKKEGQSDIRTVPVPVLTVPAKIVFKPSLSVGTSSANTAFCLFSSMIRLGNHENDTRYESRRDQVAERQA